MGDDELLDEPVQFGDGAGPKKPWEKADDAPRSGRSPIRVRLETPTEEEIRLHNRGPGRTY